jgi:hypothetical protein
MFDQMNLIKNFKNYIVDKYDYRQRGWKTNLNI